MNLPETHKHEIRAGWLNVPQAYHALDLIGAAMGAYFIWHGATDRGPNWIPVALGSIMVYIHTQRFFYAPKTHAGLTRLLKAVDLKREDVCPYLDQV